MEADKHNKMGFCLHQKRGLSGNDFVVGDSESESLLVSNRSKGKAKAKVSDHPKWMSAVAVRYEHKVWRLYPKKKELLNSSKHPNILLLRLNLITLNMILWAYLNPSFPDGTNTGWEMTRLTLISTPHDIPAWAIQNFWCKWSSSHKRWNYQSH